MAINKYWYPHPMNTDRQIKALELKIAALKARAHELDGRRKKNALSKVNAVAKKFGFASIHHLLDAADTAVVAVSTKRKRVKITAAIRKKAEKLLRSGHTVKVVAAKAGISAPSVNVIKAKAGLTKARKPAKKAAAKKRASKPKKVPNAPVGAPAPAASA